MPACTLTRGPDNPGDDDAVFEVGETWVYTCNLVAVAGTNTNTATADSSETPPDTDDATYFGNDPALNVIKEVSDDDVTWVNNDHRRRRRHGLLPGARPEHRQYHPDRVDASTTACPAAP